MGRSHLASHTSASFAPAGARICAPAYHGFRCVACGDSASPVATNPRPVRGEQLRWIAPRVQPGRIRGSARGFREDRTRNSCSAPLVPNAPSGDLGAAASRSAATEVPAATEGWQPWLLSSEKRSSLCKSPPIAAIQLRSPAIASSYLQARTDVRLSPCQNDWVSQPGLSRLGRKTGRTSAR